MPTALGDAQPPVGFRLAAGRSLRERRTAVAAAVMAVALAVAAVAVGEGLPDAAAQVRDVGAWLADSALGAITHAEGVSGKPDATIRLPGTHGDSLRIIQSGSTILVEDLRTGRISRIDPAQLTVTQTASFGAAGAQVVAGGPDAYVVLPSPGLVQRISPQTLSVIGAPVRLPSPVGTAAVTARGQLWALLPRLGELDWVSGSRAGVPLRVSGHGDAARLTLADNTPVVTDFTTRTMTIIGPARARRTITLPALAGPAGPSGPLVPPVTPGGDVPVVVAPAGRLLVVNTVTGGVLAAALGTASDAALGVPAVLGPRVYVPDDSSGRLIVYDTATGRLLSPVTVTGRPGPLQVFVNDGMLWANDPSGPDAVVVGAGGGVQHIGKYHPGLPGGPVRSSSRPPAGPATGGAPGPAPAPGGPAGRPHPGRHAPPPQPPAPPGAPASVSGAGKITVTFTPSGGATPSGYTLAGVPAGATVTPQSLPPAGQPFSFRVTGLSCARTYSFTVVAHYARGGVDSPPTPAARPCVAPSAPAGLAVTVTANHSMTLSWSPPSKTGGGAVSYDITWAGAVNGSHNGAAATSYTIGGLVNSATYSFTVTAVSAAGTSQPASGSQALTPPSHTYNTYRNSQLTLNVRAQPTQSSQSLATIPPTGGVGPQVTVLCQVTGSVVTDPVDHTLTGDLWDKLSYNGISGYISDLYVDTPQSQAGNYDSWSDPPLWQCT